MLDIHLFQLLQLNCLFKFFIMSMEFDKNISDWGYDGTDHKNGIGFFLRLVKWPKIVVKKCQNLIFKVIFQRQKSAESFLKKVVKNIGLGDHLSINEKFKKFLFCGFMPNYYKKSWMVSIRYRKFGSST